jgi:predicted transposase YbfD/YdcC
VRVVLAQDAVSHADEISTALALLEGLDLTGWIVTGAAKLTQKAIVAKIIEQGGDYVLTVKENQPTFWQRFQTWRCHPEHKAVWGGHKAAPLRVMARCV